MIKQGSVKTILSNATYPKNCKTKNKAGSQRVFRLG